MPYSVPPSPPLVVNLPSSEEVSSLNAAVPPVISSAPEFSSAPVGSAAGAALQGCLSASIHCRLGSSSKDSGAPIEAVSVNSADDLAVEPVSWAEPLGNPLQVNSAIAHPETLPVQYSLSSMPELAASYPSLLARRNRQQSRASWSAAAALSVAPVQVSQSSGAADLLQSGDQSLPFPLTPPAYPAPQPTDQSLPFPPSNPAAAPDSGQDSPQAAPQSNPSNPSNPSNLESNPSNGSAPLSPTPGGQVLTIPEPASPQPAPQLPSGQTPPPAIPRNRTPGTLPPIDQTAATEVIELNADRQEYDQLQQVFTAAGNAVMRFRQSVLSADRIQVNLPNRIAVAEGNVTLIRGQQVLKGERFEYNFVQGDGTIFAASGELDLAAAETDFSDTPPAVATTTINPAQSVGNQVNAAQPLQVTGSRGGITFGLSSGNQTNRSGVGGEINRLRFEAERADFTPDGNVVATNVRLTNDPFSPPELEIRTPLLTYTRLTQTSSELRARNPRVVFDQGFSLPLLRNRIVFDNRRRNPGLVQFGFDQRDRGGFFIERTFDVLSTPTVQFSLTPQLLLQRSYDQGNFFAGSSYGLRSRLSATVSPTTTVFGEAVLTSLDLSKVDDNLRANLGVQQFLGGYTLTVGYTFRNRLFNGSLGFQNVQRSFGVFLDSPRYTLGNTGIGFDYQASVQFINSRTDRTDLLAAVRDNDRIDLTRYQINANLGRNFLLWSGTPLPPTATEGLRYTPNPVVPYVALGTALRGTFGAYSNGETQASLTGTVALSGQFGHFSRPFLDYTAFQIAYSQTVLNGKSPFLFDRIADEQVLTLGLTQQVYGPFRFGVQTSLSLDRSRTIDTVYTLEYSRRTYAIALNFSPIRNSASLTLRISDFNWFGDPGRFSGIETPAVTNGVTPTAN